MNFLDKQIWSLYWVSIGDALWLPVETNTREEILRLLDEGAHCSVHEGLINKYYPIGRHAMYRSYIKDGKYPFLQSDTIGICSDDTLLTLVISDSIIERWWIDIASGMNWRNMQTYSFWNGMMMKQSPLAFFQVESWHSLVQKVHELTKITHAHPISLVAARIHHHLLVDIIMQNTPEFDMKYWLQEWVQLARSYELELGASSQISDLMLDIALEWDEDISLQEIGNRYVRSIDSEKNPYFNVLSTLGIVYAIFLRQQNFKAIQQWASIGWDTDSYASILWSMVGGLHWSIFQEKYIRNLHVRYQEKLQNSIQLLF